MGKRNSKDLKQAMSGRWLSAFRYLAPELNQAADKLGENVECPVDGYEDGFRLFTDANETGGGVKQGYELWEDGIGLLMWINNWSFVKTFDELEAWLGGKPGEYREARPVAVAAKPKPKDDKQLKAWLNKIWTESLPLDATSAFPARAYFKRRGIFDAAMSAKEIRYHPKMNYISKTEGSLGQYGCILMKVRNNNGAPVLIHRTFILPDGRKVDLGKHNKAKKMTPPTTKEVKGRHARLFDPKDGYLGVAEGLETALAVKQVKKLPVWPCLSNTILQNFVPPDGVHTVINFVDKDRSKAGENSHEILKANLSAKGIRVIGLYPPTPILESDEKGVDWADQLKRDVNGFDILDEVFAGDIAMEAY